MSELKKVYCYKCGRQLIGVKSETLPMCVVCPADAGEDLLPCPFCGAEEPFEQDHYEGGACYWQIHCPNNNCGVSTMGHMDKSKSYQLWNQRPAPAPLTVETKQGCPHGAKYQAECLRCWDEGIHPDQLKQAKREVWFSGLPREGADNGHSGCIVAVCPCGMRIAICDEMESESINEWIFLHFAHKDLVPAPFTKAQTVAAIIAGIEADLPMFTDKVVEDKVEETRIADKCPMDGLPCFSTRCDVRCQAIPLEDKKPVIEGEKVLEALFFIVGDTVWAKVENIELSEPDAYTPFGWMWSTGLHHWRAANNIPYPFDQIRVDCDEWVRSLEDEKSLPRIEAKGDNNYDLFILPNIAAGFYTPDIEGARRRFEADIGKPLAIYSPTRYSSEWVELRCENCGIATSDFKCFRWTVTRV